MSSSLNPQSESIAFTGERYLLSQSGPIRLEHLHRYVAVCRLITSGMTVLDIACGEGYGSALMAGFAHQVIGVDIDPDTIRHATTKYVNATDSSLGGTVTFRVGECAAIPAEDSSVDLLVSFETLEHHDQHEKMMREVRRVLRPSGILVLSSPNREVYTESTGQKNSFHVKELDRGELVALLSLSFSSVRLLGQATQLGSFLFSEARTKVPLTLGDGANCDITPGIQIIERESEEMPISSGNPARYYVAVAGEDDDLVESATAALVSSYSNPQDDTIRRLEDSYNGVLAEARKLQAYVSELEAGHRRIEAEFRSAMTEREAVVVDRDALRNRLTRIETQTVFRVARRAGLIKDSPS